MQFVALPGSIITYIVDILNNPPPAIRTQSIMGRPFYLKYDIILNVYKAFECFVYEDALWDYKKNIQHCIANYVFGEVLEQLQTSQYPKPETPLSWYNPTDREIMYVYDVLWCNPHALLHGEHYVTNMQEIQRELFDCNYYIDSLLPKCEFYKFGDHDIPAIRMLEEAMYNNSSEFINCLMESGLCNTRMYFYIYFKHNHKMRVNMHRSLANSDMLCKLLLESCSYSDKNLLLQIAIGGLLIKNSHSIDLFNNVIEPNLAMVKKMVPEYFKKNEEIPCFLGELSGKKILALRPNEFDMALIPTFRTPFAFWKDYCNRQVYKPSFLSYHFIQNFAIKNEEIGAYLSL